MAQESTAVSFFDQLLSINADKSNCKAMSLETYNENVVELQSAGNNPGKKTPRQYNLMNRFILVPGVNNDMKLARKRDNEEDSFKYVVPNEHLFEILCKENISIGHAGEDRMKRQ